jgi:tryptophanyl-tRNA synthetase
MKKKRILSGIQPSGIPHIGNYFGMMKTAIEMQGKGELFLFIADLPALTVTPKAEDLREITARVALDFLACGLDPAQTTFFRQSDVPEVCELTWILNCLTGLGFLERAHSFKDKTAKGLIPNNGLFSYPVLMAADILIYKSDMVPVGKDQKQHLEMTRDIGTRFNQQYKELFVMPEPIISESVAVIPARTDRKCPRATTTPSKYSAKKNLRARK